MTNQVEIVNASIYSIEGGMAHQIDYSEGTKVRAVVMRDGWIRKEYKKGEAWVLVGKPYVVKRDKKRDAEKLVEIAKAFLAK